MINGALRYRRQMRRSRVRQAAIDEKWGYVYLIKYDNGIVKVGMAADWGRRLAQHAQHAQAHLVQIIDYTVKRVHDPNGVEQRVVDTFSAMYERVSGREYFRADYGEALELFTRTIGGKEFIPMPVLDQEREKTALVEMSAERGTGFRRRVYLKYFGGHADRLNTLHFEALEHRADHIYCIANQRHCRPRCGCPNSFDPENPGGCGCDYCSGRT
jgi:hypothetical protein